LVPSADQNSFVLFAYGEPLAIASGYYPYYASPHHSKWTWETKASNCILTDGQGQNIRDWNAKGRIVEFRTSEYAHYALGDATQAYGGRLKRFKRHSLYLRPTIPGDEPVIILYDDLASDKAVTYDWLLHSLEQMNIEENNNAVELKRGDARLKVQFLLPGKLNFSQTDTFNVRPEGENLPDQWHLTARTASPVAEIKYITVLIPYRAGKESTVPAARLITETGWLAVELSGRETRQVVAFRTGDVKSLKLGDFRTKDDITAIAFDLAGQVRSSFRMNWEK